MTGLFAFIAAGLMMIGLVWARGRIDSGSQERRALRSQEVPMWQWFAAFEARGGRVHDLEALPDGEMLRHWTVGWRASLQVVAPVAITMTCFLLRWSASIPLLAGSLTAIMVGLFSHLALWTAGPSERAWPYVRAWPLLLVGLFAKGAVFGLGLAGLWIAASLIEARAFLVGAGLVVASVVAIDICHVPARAVERLIRVRRQARFADEATYSSILYLRSFSDDTALMYAPVASVDWYGPLLPRRARFEELMETWTFRHADQVVAIGRPGEPRPALGAQRTYWTDETWQDAVRRTAARCRAIILVAGTSEGLNWEIAQLARMGVLGKTLLLLPPDNSERTLQRYQRITTATGRRHDALVDDPGMLVTVPALGYTPDGELVHYTACGRDWASYVLAEAHLLGTLSGRGQFDAAGNLTRMFEIGEDPVMQARHAVTQMDDATLARSLLDAAWEGPEREAAARERLLVATAATELALHHDRERARDLLSVALSGSSALGGLVDAAYERLVEPATTPEDLFQMLAPDEVVGGPPRRPGQTVSPRIALRQRLLAARAESQMEGDDYEGYLATMRMMRALGESAGLDLMVATTDVGIAAGLMLLDRGHDARSLLVDVIERDLPPWQMMVFDRQTADAVRRRALELVLELVADQWEAISLLERQRAWQMDDGLRYEAAKTALQIARLRQGLARASAREWSGTAAGEFAALGLPGGQAEALTIRARVALSEKLWWPAITDAERALALAEVNGFDAQAEASLAVLLSAVNGRARMTEFAAHREAAVEWLERCLLRSGAGRGSLSHEQLLVMLIRHLLALGRWQDGIDAQQRLVSILSSVHGPAHVSIVRARLLSLVQARILLARLYRKGGDLARARREIDGVLAGLPTGEAAPVELAPGSELRRQIWLILADLTAESGDVEGALSVLAKNEAEVEAATSRVDAISSRQEVVRLLNRVGRTAEAFVMQESIVAGLTDLVGAGAPETREAIDTRNEMEWDICIQEAHDLAMGGDAGGAAARYRRWLDEHGVGGTNDWRRELSCQVRLADCLAQCGEAGAERQLRTAHRQAIVKLDRMSSVSQIALYARACDRWRAGERHLGIAYLKELHGIEIARYGEVSEEAIRTLSLLARARAETGNEVGAARSADRVINSCLARWGEDHEFTLEMLQAVAGLASARGRPSFLRPDWGGI